MVRNGRYTLRMSERYDVRMLSLPAPRLTWQGALTIAAVASGLWLLAVGMARLMLALF